LNKDVIYHFIYTVYCTDVHIYYYTIRVKSGEKLYYKKKYFHEKEYIQKWFVCIKRIIKTDDLYASKEYNLFTLQTDNKNVYNRMIKTDDKTEYDLFTL